MQIMRIWNVLKKKLVTLIKLLKELVVKVIDVTNKAVEETANIIYNMSKYIKNSTYCHVLFSYSKCLSRNLTCIPSLMEVFFIVYI